MAHASPRSDKTQECSGRINGELVHNNAPFHVSDSVHGQANITAKDGRALAAVFHADRICAIEIAGEVARVASEMVGADTAQRDSRGLNIPTDTQFRLRRDPASGGAVLANANGSPVVAFNSESGVVPPAQSDRIAIQALGRLEQFCHDRGITI
jgi:hypothetical protein